MKKIILLLLLFSCTHFVFSQNVGINTNDPTETLHLRTNNTKTVVRYDSKKSVENGVNYFTAIGTPTSVTNYVFNPNYIDWTDLDASKLVNSDNNHLNGPLLNIYPDVANNANIYFDFSPTIPSTANISNITLHAEWKRNGTAAGELRIFNILLRQALNHLPLVNFGFYTRITSSTDVNVSIPFKKIINPLTPDMLNLNDVYIDIASMYSVTPADSRLEIDKIWLEIEYNVPSDGTENVFWTAGAKEGSFRISNSEDIDSNEYLIITENGVTELQSLKIVQNAGADKFLTSNQDGLASWADLPIQSEVFWIDNNDTATYANGPLEINNDEQTALIFNQGESRLNNGDNIIETDNRLINIILDADDDQANESFAIFKDSTQSMGDLPTIRFHIDGADSWINSDGNVILGSNATPDGITSDTLFFFDPNKGALRSGILIDSDSWSDENIGIGSFASGRASLASGTASSALGFNTEASGSSSVALGSNTIAKGFSSTTIGVWNDSILVNAETSVNSTTPLFIIGNGDNNSNRSNAMVVNKNGRIGLGLNLPDHPIHHENGARLTSAGVWTNASDRRLKSEIQPLNYGLKEVMKLVPTEYIMNTSGEKQIGFIAQDLKSIIPEVVNGVEGDISKGETLGVSYGNMVALLTKAVQELSKELDIKNAVLNEKEERIKKLEEQMLKMFELEARISNLERN